MSLDRILQALESEAEGQIAAIEREGQAKIRQLQAQTEANIATLREKHLIARQAEAQAETVRIINRAKLEALQVEIGAREKLLTLAVETAAHHLETDYAAETRTELLRLLIQEAVETLAADGPLQIHVQNRDVIRAQQIVRDLALPAEVHGDRSVDDAAWGYLGGVVISPAAGQVSLVNTLDVRLQRVASLYRAQIARLLFNQPEEVRV